MKTCLHEWTLLTSTLGPHGRQDLHFHSCMTCSEYLYGPGRECDGNVPSHSMDSDRIPGRGYPLKPSMPEEFVAEALVLRQLIEQGIEAFRLTRDYVGPETFPAAPGWSWFDWVAKARRAILEIAAAEALFVATVRYLEAAGWYRDGDDLGVWRSPAWPGWWSFADAFTLQLEKDDVSLLGAVPPLSGPVGEDDAQASDRPSGPGEEPVVKRPCREGGQPGNAAPKPGHQPLHPESPSGSLNEAEARAASEISNSLHLLERALGARIRIHESEETLRSYTEICVLAHAGLVTLKRSIRVLRGKERDALEDRVKIHDLLNEVDCRIEHGAESGGHLEFVRDRLERALGLR